MTLEVTDFAIIVTACSIISSCAVVVTVYAILNNWKKEICGHISLMQKQLTNFKIKLYTHLQIDPDDEDLKSG